jgi:hypothetical protein
MKIVTILKDWARNNTKAETWTLVRDFYSKNATKENSFGTILQAIEDISQSRYRDILFPLRTMDGLILSMSETIRMGQQNILIRPGDTLTFEYQDGGASGLVRDWVRTCAPHESVKMLDRLNEHIKFLPL